MQFFSIVQSRSATGAMPLGKFRSFERIPTFALLVSKNAARQKLVSHNYKPYTISLFKMKRTSAQCTQSFIQSGVWNIIFDSMIGSTSLTPSFFIAQVVWCKIGKMSLFEEILTKQNIFRRSDWATNWRSMKSVESIFKCQVLLYVLCFMLRFMFKAVYFGWAY